MIGAAVRVARLCGHALDCALWLCCRRSWDVEISGDPLDR